MNASKTKSKSIGFFLILFVIFVFYFVSGTIFLDPDFGWHFQMGNLILKGGIPKTDPFSYTMPNFPFIDHEWLSNVIISLVYKNFGYAFLSFLFSVLAFISLLLVCNPLLTLRQKDGRLKIRFLELLFILSSSIFVLYFGIRTQVVSWLLLAVSLRLVLDTKVWNKFKFFYPVLICLWSNLHGSFPVGLVVVFLVVGVRAFVLKKMILSDLVVLLASFLATFINPYGPRIWYEIFQQYSDTRLRLLINEWKPVIFSFNAPFLLLLSTSAVFVWKFNKLLSWEEKILYLVLLSQAVSSTRHVPLWTLTTAFLLSSHIKSKLLRINIETVAKKRLKKAIGFYSLFISLLMFVSIFQGLYRAVLFSEKNFYPVGAIKFLKNHEIKGNLFNYYGWGGYLDWKLPERKVFIDGRMPSWRVGQEALGESGYAFGDYIDVFKAETYKSIFEKYNINFVIIPKSSFGKEDHNLLLLTEKLEKDDWRPVFTDEITLLYERQ